MYQLLQAPSLHQSSSDKVHRVKSMDECWTYFSASFGFDVLDHVDCQLSLESFQVRSGYKNRIQPVGIRGNSIYSMEISDSCLWLRDFRSEIKRRQGAILYASDSLFFATAHSVSWSFTNLTSRSAKPVNSGCDTGPWTRSVS